MTKGRRRGIQYKKKIIFIKRVKSGWKKGNI